MESGKTVTNDAIHLVLDNVIFPSRPLTPYRAVYRLLTVGGYLLIEGKADRDVWVVQVDDKAMSWERGGGYISPEEVRAAMRWALTHQDR